MMAQAAPVARRPAAPPPPDKPTPLKQTWLDKLHHRLSTNLAALARLQEEAAMFQSREGVDSQARPVLANLNRRLTGMVAPTQAVLNEVDTLAKLRWEPKGAKIERAAFAIGRVVRIAEEKHKHYLRHGLYDAAVIAAPATVKKIVGTQAVIELKDGSLIAPINAGWLKADA